MKSLTKSIQVSQCSFADVVPVAVPPLATVLSDVKSAFFGLCVNAGEQVLASMMEADRVALCGPRGQARGRSARAARRAHAKLADAGRAARNDAPATGPLRRVARSLRCQALVGHRGTIC